MGLWGQRSAAQAHAGGVEDRVWRGRRRQGGSSFRPTCGRQFGAVDQHDVDRLGGLGNVEDRVAEPVGADHYGVVANWIP